MDLRTLIKFHVLLSKSALAYYKSKESLGTHAVSYETVHQWVNAIKNGQEETDNAPLIGAPSSATDERNMEKVKSVLEHTRSITCMTFATEV
jgi:transposase